MARPAACGKDEGWLPVESAELPPVRCRWCGMMAPAEAKRCGHCGRALEAPARPLRRSQRNNSGWRKVSGRRMMPHVVDDGSLRVEPLPPAPGQEPFGSWANIRMILRYDPLFGTVLVLLALEMLLQVLTQWWYGAIISGVTLWGMVTFRWWGYVLAMMGGGLGVAGGLTPTLFV